MTSKRHSYDDKDNAERIVPNLPIEDAERGTTKEKIGKKLTSKKGWWAQLGTFEKIMSALTALGIVVTAMTVSIFRDQLQEMRTDERPWIAVSIGGVQFPKDGSEVAAVQPALSVTIDNTGKTPARSVSTTFVMEYVINGDSPEFRYDRPFSRDISGMIFPHDTRPFIVRFLRAQPDSSSAQPRFLAPVEFDDLKKGDAYLVVYAEATYLDLFGTKHWFHFCSRFAQIAGPGTTSTSKACTDYNDTDNN